MIIAVYKRQVDIREAHGEKYRPVLTPRNEARDVTLHFALYNNTQAGWMKQYFAFVNFLKQGKDGDVYKRQTVRKAKAEAMKAEADAEGVRVDNAEPVSYTHLRLPCSRKCPARSVWAV